MIWYKKKKDTFYRRVLFCGFGTVRYKRGRYDTFGSILGCNVDHSSSLMIFPSFVCHRFGFWFFSDDTNHFVCFNSWWVVWLHNRYISTSRPSIDSNRLSDAYCFHMISIDLEDRISFHSYVAEVPTEEPHICMSAGRGDESTLVIIYQHVFNEFINRSTPSLPFLFLSYYHARIQ